MTTNDQELNSIKTEAKTSGRQVNETPVIPLQELKNFRGKVRPTIDESAFLVTPSTESNVLEQSESNIDQAPKVVQGKIVLIPIKKVLPSPFQNRLFDVNQSEEYIANLASNINKEELTNPIIVREKGDNYELIAGENRLKAYESNGEEFIPAIIKDFDDVAAAKKTVLDNVFHKNVTAYELYRGYSMLLEMKAFSSQAQLANEVGLSTIEMSRILSFGKLPKESLKLIETKPHLIGSTVASELAALYPNNQEAVMLAIEKVISEEMQQSRAPGFVKTKKEPKNTVPNKPIKNINGETEFTIKSSENELVIRKTKYASIPDLEDQIMKFLEDKLNNSN